MMTMAARTPLLMAATALLLHCSCAVDATEQTLVLAKTHSQGQSLHAHLGLRGGFRVLRISEVNNVQRSFSTPHIVRSLSASSFDLCHKYSVTPGTAASAAVTCVPEREAVETRGLAKGDNAWQWCLKEIESSRKTQSDDSYTPPSSYAPRGIGKTQGYFVNSNGVKVLFIRGDGTWFPNQIQNVLPQF